MDQKFDLKFYDRARIPWIIKFYVNSFAGSVETLKGSGTPLKIEYTNSSDDIYDPWRPSRAVIEIQVGVNFKFTDLFTEDNLSTFVEIYQNTDDPENLYWTGWVDPSQYEEPYDVPPYYLTITCEDGLAYLADMAFAIEENSDGTYEYYEGRATEAQIILDILGKIEYTEFIEFIGFYEDNMSTDDADSPMTQLLLDRDRFMGNSCQEVLVELLKKYGAAIRQQAGIFQIYRPTDLHRGAISGRYFTGAGSTSPISLAPLQYIHRSATHPSSALRQIPGSRTMQQLPAKRININQEYGSRDSWLDNHTLGADTYNYGPTYSFDDWTWADLFGYGGVPLPIEAVVPGEDSGVLLPWGIQLIQNFGTYAKQCADEYFVIEFEYGFYSIAAKPQDDVWAASFSIELGNKYSLRPESDDATDLYWSPYLGTSIIPGRRDGIVYGWNGWNSYKGKFNELPVDGPMKIRLNSFGGSTIRACYRNIRFYASSSNIIQMSYKRTFWERLRELTPWGTGDTVVYGRVFPMARAVLSATKKWVLKKERVVTETIIESTYNPYPYVDHGQVLDYNFALGDIVKESDPPLDGDTNITNNLEQYTGGFAVISTQTLKEVVMKFVSDWYSYWITYGVRIWYEENSAGVPTIMFKSTTLGGDFTTGAAISATNGITGDAFVVTAAGGGGSQKIVTIVFDYYTYDAGDYGVLTINGYERQMDYYGYSITETLEHFVLRWEFPDITMEYSAKTLTIYGPEDGSDFLYTWVDTGGLTATDTVTQVASAMATRQDAIEFSGTSGYATVSCNGGSKTIAFALGTSVPSSQWGNGDPSSDAWPHKPLLQLLGDEIAGQYSRVKQLIQMKIIETRPEVSGLNMLGSFVDTENEYDGAYRVFVANRGSFDVRHRMWEIDMIELIPYEGPFAEIPAEEESVPELPSAFVPSSDEYSAPEESEDESSDAGMSINSIATIADGRVGTTLVASFNYTSGVTETHNISYYFSSDAAGNIQITAPAIMGISITSGTHDASITGLSYVSGAKYLQVKFVEDLGYEASNEFDSVTVTITSVVYITVDQEGGELLSPGAQFNATVSGGSVVATAYWRLRYGTTTLDSGSKSFTFESSTKYSFDAIVLPEGQDYLSCRIEIGWSTKAYAYMSNAFNIYEMLV